MDHLKKNQCNFQLRFAFLPISPTKDSSAPILIKSVFAHRPFFSPKYRIVQTNGEDLPTRLANLNAPRWFCPNPTYSESNLKFCPNLNLYIARFPPKYRISQQIVKKTCLQDWLECCGVRKWGLAARLAGWRDVKKGEQCVSALVGFATCTSTEQSEPTRNSTSTMSISPNTHTYTLQLLANLYSLTYPSLH
jgi:hypothetical protein